MEQLAGRVAVVTGGASGIGLAMAQRLAAEGMRIVLADIERPVLARAGDELARAGVDVLTVPADVSLAADVEALAATTLEHFGDVHLVCNNAGVGSRGLPIAELPLEDFSWVLGVNLFGVIHGIRSFLPHLLRNGVGHIVNTASISGLYHLPRMGPYNASKAAVIALSETLRFELDGAAGSACPCSARAGCGRTSARPTATDRSASPTRSTASRWPRPRSTRRSGASSWRRSPSTRRRSPSRSCDAVRTDRFYVITHPESVAVFEERARRILAGDNPVEPPQ